MTGPAFMAFLRSQTQSEHVAYRPGEDPEVEMYDGYVRVFDQRGESCMLKFPQPHQLRALATMLTLCADEIDRRTFEP